MAYLKGTCYTIYMYTAPDGRHYIGKTGNQQAERSGLNGIGYKHCRRFWDAIEAFGWESFTYKVLATIPKSDPDAEKKACEEESRFIRQYHTTDPRFGFNTFAKDTPRSYAKLAESRRGRRVINKNGVIKQIPGSEFEKYLQDGWSAGFARAF